MDDVDGQIEEAVSTGDIWNRREDAQPDRQDPPSAWLASPDVARTAWHYERVTGHPWPPHRD